MEPIIHIMFCDTALGGPIYGHARYNVSADPHRSRRLEISQLSGRRVDWIQLNKSRSNGETQTPAWLPLLDIPDLLWLNQTDAQFCSDMLWSLQTNKTFSYGSFSRMMVWFEIRSPSLVCDWGGRKVIAVKKKMTFCPIGYFIEHWT